ncbi:Serpin-ZX [Platanthera zijinensis]|uniref:Serpin-ZX n=1 Tax=Platanthera zijinensis TaxID=2320716 RepID=A0AAP0BE05_9ASPA
MKMGPNLHLAAHLPRIHPRWVPMKPQRRNSTEAQSTNLVSSLPATRDFLRLHCSKLDYSTPALSMRPPPLSADSFTRCLQIAELAGIPAVDEGSNFVFSPLSLVAALSLTASGARGETLREILSFLGSPNLDHLHSASVHLAQAVRADDRELILSFVNGAWVDRSMAVNPSFVAVAASVYGAAIEPVDFIHQASLEQKKINSWIEEKTNGIIKNLIFDGTLNNLTRLILANALYFKGKWKDKFDNSMTKTDKFYLLDGSTIHAPFMSSREKQFISSYNGFTVLKLPYKKVGDGQDSRSFSMLLFLPNERNGLHDLIRRIVSTPNFVQEHVPPMRVYAVRFMVPKFKISFNFDASDVLKQLGLKSIFGSSSADLGGICLESSGVEPLFVSNILHEAAVEVDEEGTTAAATTVIIGLGSCYTPPVDFVADHPFIFVVREDKTGAILFFGHVVNPSI